jgi:hypothetical protein
MRKYVKPWIGKQYNRRSQHGMKVLIMGESAYDWKENGRVRTASVKQIINWYWKKGQYGKSKFPRNLVKLFLSDEEREPKNLEGLWNSVAYANFIQSRVGIGARARPTTSMCRDSFEPTEALISEIAPDCIIIASRLAWNWLKGLGRPGPRLRVKGSAHETRIFPTSKGQSALAVRVLHPARRDFRPEEWKPVISRTLDAARKRLG